MVRLLDQDKVNKILNFLKEHPEGTYVSEISRATNLAKSTVSFLLNIHLKSQIEEVIVGRKNLFKIIRLRK